MRKSLLIPSALVFALAGNAQVTITTADFGSIGDQVFIGIDNTPGLTIGGNGAGQVWSFQNLNTENLDTLFFVDPSSTPFASNFPNANVATSSNDGLIFFNNQTGSLTIEGFAFVSGQISAGLAFAPPQDLIQFPAGLGDSYSTTSTGSGTAFVGFSQNVVGCQIDIDSVRIVRHSNLSVSFEAEGELRTPIDTVNALRAYSEEETIDSIFIYSQNGTVSQPICIGVGINIPAGWSLAPDQLAQYVGLPAAVIQDTMRLHTWYANGKDFAVVAIEVDGQNNQTEAKFQSNSSQIGLSTDKYDLNNKVRVFPVPATDVLNFDITALKGETTVKVIDITGKTVMNQILNAQGQLNIQGLAAGSYSYVLTNNNGQLVSQGKFSVVK